MTAAHDNRSEALKEAAVLRSLAEAVASPVVAGRKSRRALTSKQRGQWSQIADRVSNDGVKWDKLKPETLAYSWKRECKFAGIGTGLFGWLVWNWAFPLLLELAKLWIESRKQGQDSER
jgi:hypothetical protein